MIKGEENTPKAYLPSRIYSRFLFFLNILISPEISTMNVLSERKQKKQRSLSERTD